MENIPLADASSYFFPEKMVLGQPVFNPIASRFPKFGIAFLYLAEPSAERAAPGDLGPSRYDLPAEKGKNARRAGAAPIGFPIICECSLHFGHLRAPARRRPLPH